MAVTLYGIKTCDTCRKALKALAATGVDATFHDVRADGLTPKQLTTWAGQADWKTLLNTRSTTWRNLPDKDKEPLDEKRALALIEREPTLLKRPVLEADGALYVGWSKATAAALGAE
ncbi:MAG: Spx/MgsR family RNA polymerase-binding regulatory protein [Pseudomonadota bacterium]